MHLIVRSRDVRACMTTSVQCTYSFQFSICLKHAYENIPPHSMVNSMDFFKQVNHGKISWCFKTGKPWYAIHLPYTIYEKAWSTSVYDVTWYHVIYHVIYHGIPCTSVVYFHKGKDTNVVFDVAH